MLRDLGVRPEERVLLALSDGFDFVATWFAVLKIGAVVAEVYTFLQAKDYAYYLDYTRAGVAVVDAVTLEAFREAAPRRTSLRHLLVVGAEADASRGEVPFAELVAGRLRQAGARRDDQGRRRPLEVHDRLARVPPRQQCISRTTRSSPSTTTRSTSWA